MMLAGEPLASAKGAMVLLHGRGADARDILGIAKYLDADNLALAAPQAPGNAWYPRTFLAPLEENEPALSRSLSIVGETLAALERSGIPRSRTFLLGFSQGACLAAHYCALNPRKYAGIFCLAGGLIGKELPAFSGDMEGTRAFFGCAERDPHIPRERVEQSAAILSKLGCQVTTKLYPGGEHSINDDEIETINSIIASINIG